MDYFKIECQGAFKAGRGILLLGSVNDVLHRDDPDLVLVSSDGELIHTYRCIMGLYSKTLPDIVNSVPCCQNTALSVPFTANTINSLLKLVTLGVSNPVNQQSLAGLTECAQVLGISLQGLEVVPQKNVVTLEVGKGEDLKSLLQNKGGLQVAKFAAKIGPRGGAGASQKTKSKARPSNSSKMPGQRFSDDDIIEITPEMYAQSTGSAADADIVESTDADIMPHHFLMQGGDTSYNGDQSLEGWNTHDDNSWDHTDPKVEEDPSSTPEVNEVPCPEDPNVMVYTCSFCPGQYFKKRNDINRHLKKHVPIEMRKRFQCEMCKEKFINNSNLKVHMKVCTGKIKEFKCKKCGDVQHNKTDHIEHLARVHNVVKKHGCPICHKQLKKTSDLKKHMATHSNQKPFTCEVCGKKFKTESYVKVHMKSHFPDGQIPEHLLTATVKPAADNASAATAEADTSATVETVDDQNGDYFSGRTSPLSEDPRSDAVEDSDMDTANNKLIIADEDDDGEDHLIIDAAEIPETDDSQNAVGDNCAPMEFDEDVDSPAVHERDTESPEETVKINDITEDKMNGIDESVVKSGKDDIVGIQNTVQKKDLYVSQISMLRNSTEIA